MQTPIRKILSAVLSAVLLLSAVSTAIPAGAAPASDAVSAELTTVTVTAEEIASEGACEAIQNALDLMRPEPAPYRCLKVVVEPGSYTLNSGLLIYSNTCLSLYGVTLTRSGTTKNMLRVSGSGYDYDSVTGYYYENIILEGGTFDAGGTSNTAVKFAHAKNVLLKDVTLHNVRNAHLAEIAGVDGFTVKNCTFADQVLNSGTDGYEALQLDILEASHIVECRPEDLPMKNVLIEGCTFKNVPRGVGSHTSIVNNPLDTITIRGNTFQNMSSAAIQTLDWVNCTITENVIDTCPRGIAVYTIRDNADGTYLPSTLAQEGDTAARASDAYQAHKTNTLIACNTIKNCGSVKDVHANYECLAIAAIGTRINTQVSGMPPKGDYFCDGVTIRDNAIDVRGNGVRVEYAKNISVEGNLITCSVNTVKTANYYGVVFRNEVSAASIQKNHIGSAEVNAIYVNAKCAVDTIASNTVTAPGKYGIGIENSTVNTIGSNDISAPVNHGIFFKDAATVCQKVTGNRIQNGKADGIRVNKECTVKLIEKNTTNKCKAAIGYTKSAGKVKLGTNYITVAALTSVKADKTAVSLKTGESFRVALTPTPVNAITTYTYSSDKASVASVNSLGQITALAAGTAKITAKSANGKTAVVTVTVTAPDKTVMGDLDGDGFVTILDVSALTGYIAGRGPKVSKSLADCNADSVVDARDRAVLYRYLEHENGYTSLPIKTASAVSAGAASVSAPREIGNSVAFDITASANPGFALAELEIQYDISVLTLEIAEESAELASVQLMSEPTANGIRLSLLNDLATADIQGEVTLCTLYFIVDEDALAGSYPVSIQPASAFYDSKLRPCSMQLGSNAYVIEEEPTTAEHTTAEPTTAEPTTAEPTTAEPTTAEPTTAEPTTEPLPQRILGDVNNDGAVDINDATLVQLHAGQVSLIDAENRPYADVNGDGVIDVGDATLIQMKAAGFNAF